MTDPVHWFMMVRFCLVIVIMARVPLLFSLGVLLMAGRLHNEVPVGYELKYQPDFDQDQLDPGERG